MTTSDTEMTWEILNAYIDGELDRATSAQVAAVAAQDATLAARIATLSKLKACTIGPSVASVQIPALPAPIKERRHRLRFSAAIAAGVTITLALGIWTFRSPVRTADDLWLRSALAAQRQWTGSAPQNSRGDRSLVTLGAATAARVIDLSDADLKLVYAATMPPFAGKEVVFLGYRGSHGCTVGLWIGAPQDAVGSTPQPLDAGDIRVRAWRDQDAGYALLSKGMDAGRIDRLADAVKRLADSKTGDDSIRTALQEVSRTGAPCHV